MHIIEAHLSGPIEWRIHRDDPLFITLQSLAGWSLINPLLYPELVSSMHVIPYWTIALHKDAVLLKTNAMLFTFPGTNDEAFKALSFYFPDFLSHLRLVSKQMDLARIQYGGGPITPGEKTLPELRFPDPAPDSSMWIQNCRLQSAIMKDHIEQADRNIVNGYFPIPRMVLLDAVLAFLDRDDRRALLYAAMAVEILAEKKIDEAGIANRRGRPGESTIEKRLHRQAREAFGRSLKVENPTLYQQAEKLYHTRNKIVHEGVIPKTDVFFQIDNIESRMAGNEVCAALLCACDIFAWLGEKDDYMPERGMQAVQVPVGAHPLDTVYPGLLPRLFY
jgi:Apea-like HEPN